MKKRIENFFIDILVGSYIALIFYKIFYQKFILDLRYSEFDWQAPLYSLYVGILWAIIFLWADDFRKKVFKIILFFLFIITFITGYTISQVSLKEFFSESGIMGAKRIFSSLMNPNWAIFNEGIIAAVETIYMAFMATIIAIPFAFFLSFFAAKNLMKKNILTKTTYSFVRVFLNISRSIEALVWAIIFSVWVGIGPFAGMLALCIHSIASLTKLYSEQIEIADEGTIEAVSATGAHPIQIIWFGIVPQIILPYISFTIYRWDINVRMATIIGMVGGGGIGNLLMQYQGQARWNEVGLLVIVIAVIVWIMDLVSSHIRQSLK